MVGIFTKKGTKEEGEFRQVAKDLAPDGGILFAVTYDPKVAKKYLDGSPPAVAAFTNFDPETGLSKKHVKGKAFTTEFEYAALYTWVYAEALPCVTRIPINMGPDASKRNRVSSINLLAPTCVARLHVVVCLTHNTRSDLLPSINPSVSLRLHQRLLWAAAYRSYSASRSPCLARTRRRRTPMAHFFEP